MTEEAVMTHQWIPELLKKLRGFADDIYVSEWEPDGLRCRGCNEIQTNPGICIVDDQRLPTHAQRETYSHPHNHYMYCSEKCFYDWLDRTNEVTPEPAVVSSPSAEISDEVEEWMEDE